MFKTEGQDIKGGGVEKSLQPGVVKAHIYSATVKTASTGSKALEFILEGPAIPNFEGWAIDKNNQEGPKFKGQSSRVSATIYTKDFNSDDVNKNEILSKIIVIANELGLRKQIDELANDASISSIEKWVEAAIEILKDKDIYWFLAGKEEEYNDKIIVKLSLPKYKFCSADETKLNKFDKSNKYHYSPFVTKAVSNFEPANDDFSM
jgi:hypothetical protein